MKFARAQKDFADKQEKMARRQVEINKQRDTVTRNGNLMMVDLVKSERKQRQEAYKEARMLKERLSEMSVADTSRLDTATNSEHDSLFSPIYSPRSVAFSPRTNRSQNCPFEHVKDSPAKLEKKEQICAVCKQSLLSQKDQESSP